jgi:DNA-binding helix-hairpin-helix protein with protein kinase domain
MYGGKPAYLMQRARGELLQSMLRQKKITPENRLPIARALARAMRMLRSSQLVHADVNPENMIAHEDQTGWTVFVLDIDGGGLLSPPGPVYPMSQPKRLYKAPELFTMQWKQLYERHLFFAPDAWALAVFLYQLLVDYEGPFCTVQTHPNPTVTNYVPFKTYAYRDTAVAWPLPWQEELIRDANLSPQIVSLFYKTFGDRFALETKPRPTAAQWEATLSRALSVSQRSSVFEVRKILPARRARGKKQRRAGLLTPRGAFRWAAAFAGIFHSLHLRRGAFGNG